MLLWGARQENLGTRWHKVIYTLFMYSLYLQIDAFIFFTEPLRAILNSFQLAFKMHLLVR